MAAMRNASPRQHPSPDSSESISAGKISRSATEIDLQREAALIALDVGEPDFGEMKAGDPLISEP